MQQGRHECTRLFEKGINELCINPKARPRAERSMSIDGLSTREKRRIATDRGNGEIIFAANGTFLDGNAERVPAQARTLLLLQGPRTVEIYRYDSLVGFQAK